MTFSRRETLGLAAATTLVEFTERGEDPVSGDTIAGDLQAYIGFGAKHAGGRGDQAAAEWMASKLAGLGFSLGRETIDVPWFEPSAAMLAMPGVQAKFLPVGIAVQTPAAGTTAPLVHVDPLTGEGGSLAGAIALIELPYGRWSTSTSPSIARPLERAMAGGAVAAVIVTTGPTGATIALNADGRRPVAERPVAVIGSKLAQPFLAAARRGEPATLTLLGKGGRRPATNLVARIDRGRGRWLVVSTPRSGWTQCGGERGPGIAAFLELARHAASHWKEHDLLFLCNSGHEYENLGAEHAIERSAPAPAQTAFWLHLGANVAARDWHEAGATGLLPLPSADPQRFLMTSQPLVERARHLFAEHAGLEMAYPVSAGASGELANIAAAGYPRIAGIFGAHRFHHVAEDDDRCVDAQLVHALMKPIRGLIDFAIRH